ncbi:hypothetical protein NPIL_683571 [Nephila pilipes]|uniref:Uncharacterized protein n=1 Tax=Nephila pilipes TaxID=299642 RepID=A0A8X6MU45_NEPPI|nr:hypothetical protein NPIL_683571 [Nephila pilipes]
MDINFNVWIRKRPRSGENSRKRRKRQEVCPSFSVAFGQPVLPEKDSSDFFWQSARRGKSEKEFSMLTSGCFVIRHDTVKHPGSSPNRNERLHRKTKASAPEWNHLNAIFFKKDVGIREMFVFANPRLR